MQLNCPVAGSSDSMLSTNPGCAWMRGRNWLFIAFLKSFSLAGLMVQVMRRESMFSSFCGKIGNEGFGSPKRTSLGIKGTVLRRSYGVKNWWGAHRRGPGRTAKLEIRNWQLQGSNSKLAE